MSHTLANFSPRRWLSNLCQSPYMPKARHWLVGALVILMTISLVMIASASVPFAQAEKLPELKFFWSQLLYIIVGTVVGCVVYRIPLKWYFAFPLVVSAWALLILLLLLTLLMGDSINGAKRWLDLGVINLQVAEFAKLLMVIVVADYVVRRAAEVRANMMAGWRLMFWFLPVTALIMLQPDYGSVLVILATSFVMLFISGIPYLHSLALVVVSTVVAGIGIKLASYRAIRVASFWNPYDDVQGTDFQPARALAAFARGGVDGVGYSNSILKLSHLPEAHTDYILAITGEELGLIGVSLVLTLEIIIIVSIMRISYNALKRRQLRLSYVAFGFATILFGQVFINAGMNISLLPPKGLTLPFYSFGGSSMVVMLMMVAIILKIDARSPVIEQENTNREY